MCSWGWKMNHLDCESRDSALSNNGSRICLKFSTSSSWVFSTALFVSILQLISTFAVPTQFNYAVTDSRLRELGQVLQTRMALFPELSKLRCPISESPTDSFCEGLQWRVRSSTGSGFEIRSFIPITENQDSCYIGTLSNILQLACIRWRV